MTIKSKIIALNVVAASVSLLLGAILVLQSHRESRALKSFAKVSELLVQMIRIGDALTNESGGVWRTSAKHTPAADIPQGLVTYRERIASTDALIDGLRQTIASMDLEAHTPRFRDLVGRQLDIEPRLAPIRAISSDPANDPWPTTLLYNEQIKWLVGLISQLATETSDAELVRTISVSDLTLQTQLMFDRHVGLLNYALSTGAVTEMVTTRFDVYLADSRPLVSRIRMLVAPEAIPSFEANIDNPIFQQIETVTKMVFDSGAIFDGQNKKFDPQLVANTKQATADLSQGIPIFRDLILSDIETYTAARSAQASAAMLKSILAMLAGTLVCGIGGWYIVNRIDRSISSVAQQLEDSSLSGQKLSHWVSHSSNELAAGCSEQAASVEEIHSTMEQIKSMATDSVNRVEDVLALAAKTNESAQNSSGSMRSMRVAMNKIQVSSSEIANIVKEIEEIAFQTNILALNAAVEAARAGVAGAGFAIVADEVRTLAQKSAASANSTREKIENARRSVAEGTKLSEDVERQLEQILGGIVHFKTAMNEVESISEQQRAAIDEVAVAITDIDNVTQRNAAAAEESASASQEMDTHSRRILDQIKALESLLIGARSTPRPPQNKPHSNPNPTPRPHRPNTPRHSLSLTP